METPCWYTSVVHPCVAPIWRPENSVNIWNWLWLSRRLIICTEQTNFRPKISLRPNYLPLGLRGWVIQVACKKALCKQAVLTALGAGWEPRLQSENQRILAKWTFKGPEKTGNQQQLSQKSCVLLNCCTSIKHKPLIKMGLQIFESP